MDYKDVIRLHRRLNQAAWCCFKEKYAPMLPDGLGFEGRIIGFLYSNGGTCSLKDIMGSFRINKSTASEMVSKLIKGGFVEQLKDEKDKRKRILRLTKKGIKHKEEAVKVFDKFEKDMVRGISEDELNTFADICKKVLENAGGDDDGRREP